MLIYLCPNFSVLSATQVWLLTWCMEMQHKSLWWFATYNGDVTEHVIM